MALSEEQDVLTLALRNNQLPNLDDILEARIFFDDVTARWIEVRNTLSEQRHRNDSKHGEAETGIESIENPLKNESVVTGRNESYTIQNGDVESLLFKRALEVYAVVQRLCGSYVWTAEPLFFELVIPTGSESYRQHLKGLSRKQITTQGCEGSTIKFEGSLNGSRTGSAPRRLDSDAEAADIPYVLLRHRVGDNTEEEWFLVFILRRLTALLSGASVTVKDADGDPLLIESAYFLPDWVTPQSAVNRVFIRQGAVQLIAPSRGRFPAVVTSAQSAAPPLISNTPPWERQESQQRQVKINRSRSAVASEGETRLSLEQALMALAKDVRGMYYAPLAVERCLQRCLEPFGTRVLPSWTRVVPESNVLHRRSGRRCTGDEGTSSSVKNKSNNENSHSSNHSAATVCSKLRKSPGSSSGGDLCLAELCCRHEIRVILPVHLAALLKRYPQLVEIALDNLPPEDGVVRRHYYRRRRAEELSAHKDDGSANVVAGNKRIKPPELNQLGSTISDTSSSLDSFIPVFDCSELSCRSWPAARATISGGVSSRDNAISHGKTNNRCGSPLIREGCSKSCKPLRAVVPSDTVCVNLLLNRCQLARLAGLRLRMPTEFSFSRWRYPRKGLNVKQSDPVEKLSPSERRGLHRGAALALGLLAAYESSCQQYPAIWAFLSDSELSTSCQASHQAGVTTAPSLEDLLSAAPAEHEIVLAQRRLERFAALLQRAWSMEASVDPQLFTQNGGRTRIRNLSRSPEFSWLLYGSLLGDQSNIKNDPGDKRPVSTANKERILRQLQATPRLSFRTVFRAAYYETVLELSEKPKQCWNCASCGAPMPFCDGLDCIAESDNESWMEISAEDCDRLIAAKQRDGRFVELATSELQRIRRLDSNSVGDFRTKLVRSIESTATEPSASVSGTAAKSNAEGITVKSENEITPNTRGSCNSNVGAAEGFDKQPLAEVEESLVSTSRPAGTSSTQPTWLSPQMTTAKLAAPESSCFTAISHLLLNQSSDIDGIDTSIRPASKAGTVSTDSDLDPPAQLAQELKELREWFNIKRPLCSRSQCDDTETLLLEGKFPTSSFIRSNGSSERTEAAGDLDNYDLNFWGSLSSVISTRERQQLQEALPAEFADLLGSIDALRTLPRLGDTESDFDPSEVSENLDEDASSCRSSGSYASTVSLDEVGSGGFGIRRHDGQKDTATTSLTAEKASAGSHNGLVWEKARTCNTDNVMELNDEDTCLKRIMHLMDKELASIPTEVSSRKQDTSCSDRMSNFLEDRSDSSDPESDANSESWATGWLQTGVCNRNNETLPFRSAKAGNLDDTELENILEANFRLSHKLETPSGVLGAATILESAVRPHS